MEIPTDAEWIVRELLDELIGMAHFRKIEKEMEAKKKGDVKNVAKEEQDWVNLMDAEKQEDIDEDCECETDCDCEVTESVDEDESVVDCDLCFGRCVCDEENEDRKDVVVEKKEEKLPGYANMRFNWKEVDPIFKG